MTRAIALTVLVAALALPVPARGDQACPHLTVIGAAGSGQAPGTGPQVAEVADRIDAVFTRAGRVVDVRPLDYPAIDVVRTLGLALFDGRYEASVSTGASHLVAEVTEVRRACPQSVIVLIGYSQGAHVVKAAVPHLTTTTPIAAIVLLADPTTALVDEVVRLGTERTDDGTLGPLSLPLRYLARTIDVCADGDVFCGAGRLRFGAHTGGYGDLVDLATARIAALATGALRASTGRAISAPPTALIR